MMHTAGPWRIDPPSEQTPNLWIVAEGNSGVCKIEPCDYDDGQGHRITDEDEANARLIAAAPSLYEALRSVINHWNEFGPEYGFDEAIHNAGVVLAKVSP